MKSSFRENNIIEQIKDKTDIVDVISEVVSLKRAGNNYKGLCPFHAEKTPSFVVSQDKQIFTCFGCGATGDVLEFTKRYYNLEFNEAIEKLAKNVGIEYTPYKQENVDKYKTYYEINREAALLFFKNLATKRNIGYQYIRKRGISDATIKKFGIGYAPDSWDFLCNHFKGKYQFSILKELGLVSEKNGKYFDKFRNRLIFPIIDTRGRVIGFGGRAIGNAEPKYLNSPENAIFKKKNNLYGLNICKKDISKLDKALLVEGYMDVVSLAQAGINITVASLGTALTKEQAMLLKRYSKNIILSYDSDQAGINATLRGLSILLESGCKPKVLVIDGAKDPDEFLQKNGRDEFNKLIDFALSHTQYRIDTLKSKYNLDVYEEKIEFIREVAIFLKELSPVEADVYISKLASEINVSANAIKLEMRGIKKQDKVNSFKNETKVSNAKIQIDVFEKTFLRLAMYGIDFFISLKNSSYSFKSEYSKSLFDKIGDYYSKKSEFDFDDFKIQGFESAITALLADVWENVKLGEKADKILQDCLKNIKMESLRTKENELILQISIAEENEENHKEDILRLQQELLYLRTNGGLEHG
ncbi:MAG: DNA primase [Eubacteriales bacterium]